MCTQSSPLPNKPEVMAQQTAAPNCVEEGIILTCQSAIVNSYNIGSQCASARFFFPSLHYLCPPILLKTARICLKNQSVCGSPPNLQRSTNASPRQTPIRWRAHRHCHPNLSQSSPISKLKYVLNKSDLQKGIQAEGHAHKVNTHLFGGLPGELLMPLFQCGSILEARKVDA